MKKVIKSMVWIIVIFLLAFGGFVLYITLADYKPDNVISLVSVSETSQATPVKHDTFELVSWNIGYAGLGAEMDFFYDGGKKVRPTKEMGRKYLDGIKKFIGDQDIDYWLFQEIDVKSKRSHGMNEVEEIESLFPKYHNAFTINYLVPFVPVPLTEPMGHVKGGMMTSSRFLPIEVTRYAYPLIASWPNRLFLLDRCFILSRTKLASGKDLVVLNTHNSAYVYDSTLRDKEFQIIKDKMLEEYAKGNFVVAGGDWNANPVYFEPKDNFNGHRFVKSEVQMNPALFPENWQWAFDASAPTNRNNNKAFEKGENGTTCLDYFIVSPNVEILNLETIDLNFENSDHNPVYLKIRVK
jgi:endonuclease/exonuclease/phosphatase family metal-dependent hydrolase